jgi:hypothetical protein
MGGYDFLRDWSYEKLLSLRRFGRMNPNKRRFGRRGGQHVFSQFGCLNYGDLGSSREHLAASLINEMTM